MKRTLKLFLLFTLCTIAVKAQEENDEGFRQVWDTDFLNKAKVLSAVDDSGKYVIGTDDNEGTLLDGDGNLIWHNKFKEITGKEGVNNANIQNVYFDAGLLFLFDKKTGKDKISVIELKTGKGLWTSNEYQNLTEDNMEYIWEQDAFLFSLKSSVVMVNARTGQKIWETDKFKGSIGAYKYLPDTKEIIMVNYKPTTLGALFSGFKNQLVRINALNGDVKWDASFLGFVEKEVVTRKALVKIFLKDNKVFLQLDGVQVFDFNTGASLWRAVYETDEDIRRGFWNRGPHGGKVLKGGIYNAIADPLIDGNAVYVVLGGDKLKQKYIQKIDYNTGKVLWTSEKINSAQALPALHLVEGKLIVQIGGLVNKQTVEQVTEKGPDGNTIITYYNSEYVFIGSYGIAAVDPETGSKIWRSEKFDKRVSNLIFGTGIVYAGGGDEFYGFDLATGEMKIDVDHSKGKVGKTMWAFDNGDNVALICDNGIAAYSKKDGSNVYTTDKFRGVTNYHKVGNNFFIRKEKTNSNTIAAIDLKTGVIKGIVKSKGKGGGDVFGDGFDITGDGEYILSFKGKGVQRLKVNK